jgi:RimJ/RimL family protein N-acetyltransferase
MAPRPFEGELVRLRAREESDAANFYLWINDWDTVKYLGQRYPRSMKFEREQMLNSGAGYGEAHFIIETKDDRRAIGWLGLHAASGEDRATTLGIAIGDHDFLDGGYGTDAMRVACRIAFDVMNLNRVELTVYDWNERAIRVYEKVGFQKEGVLRDKIFKAGRWNNLVLMSLLRGELK